MKKTTKYSFPPVIRLGGAVLLLLLATTTGLWAQSPQQENPVRHQLFLPLIDSRGTVAQIADEMIAQPDLSQEGNVTDEGSDQPNEPNIVHQGQVAARAADIGLVAQASGLAVEEVERAISFQETFAAYVDELMARYPEQISAVWTEAAPSQRGYIRFTGEVPAAIATQLARSIVASQRQPGTSSVTLTQDNVVLSGGGIFSMAEHGRRAELAAAALADQGYQNTVTFFDQMSQQINVEMQLPAGAATPDKADLTTVIQSRIQRDQAARGLTALPLDLNLTFLAGAGPIVEPQHTRGGNWVRDDGARECTSGWSVRSGTTSTGFITAGHCDGINQFEEPGVTLYSAPFIRQVYGTNGDAEYHTTPSHVVVAEFYADATTRRSVTGIRSTSTMVGNSVCVYGRSSNVRNCYTVQAINVTVTTNTGVTVSKLARTSGSSTIGGDSGGGWSFNTIAWGVHHGRDSLSRGYFTPIQQAQSALGVTVLTQ